MKNAKALPSIYQVAYAAYVIEMRRAGSTIAEDFSKVSTALPFRAAFIAAVDAALKRKAVFDDDDALAKEVQR